MLEVGPGTGILTQYLLERPVNLLAVELDQESVRYLQERFTPEMKARALPYKDFNVLQADFLSLSFEQCFDGAPFAVAGNFPYNISSQILFKVLENRSLVPEFSGMFQKEVAQRICAGPGSKTYGILSVLTQAYYTCTYCFTVPPQVFLPPPKVDSGVIHLSRKDAPAPDWDETLLRKVVKLAFNQRRKTLRNSLKSLGLSDNLKEDAIFDRRPEQLAVPEFIALVKSIADDTL
jgi:16S rRNA (adenine1518-N6/adenine1519-N6)-dimethyltransferase